MKYLALGDSISIDDYTGVTGGGAASQFARLLPATQFVNLTRDGCITDGVLEALDMVTKKPDVITLTIGGNDFLQGLMYVHAGAATVEGVVAHILKNVDRICDRLRSYRAATILNTIYDPTDGDDRIAQAIGIPPQARTGFQELNAGLRRAAGEYGFSLCDLEALFRGHGAAAAEPWIVSDIEPNLAGATAIAQAWREIAVSPPQPSPTLPDGKGVGRLVASGLRPGGRGRCPAQDSPTRT